jgi:hypothetical protein
MLAAAEEAAAEKKISRDVAWDCRKFNYNRGVPLEQIVRGDGFIMSGKIFPAGTLLPGNQNNDPNAAGSIGAWVGWGTSTGSLDEHLADPTAPGIFWTQYFLLSNGMLVGEGWFAPVGTNEAAIVGGTRAFFSASGRVSAMVIGTNVTGCANVRYTIALRK